MYIWYHLRNNVSVIHFLALDILDAFVQCFHHIRRSDSSGSDNVLQHSQSWVPIGSVLFQPRCQLNSEKTCTQWRRNEHCRSSATCIDRCKVSLLNAIIPELTKKTLKYEILSFKCVHALSRKEVTNNSDLYCPSCKLSLLNIIVTERIKK